MPFLEGSFPGRFTSFSNVETLQVSNLSPEFLDTTVIERTFCRLAYSLRSLDVLRLTTDSDKWCLLVSLLPNLG